MKDHYEEIRQLGAEVVAVNFTSPDRIRAFLERYPMPFPFVADPDRAGYRTFELGKASWGNMLGFRSILGYLKLMFCGWLPKKPAEGDDVFQLGGDFVLNKERRLVYAYRSATPTDRPAMDDLLGALRSIQP